LGTPPRRELDPAARITPTGTATGGSDGPRPLRSRAGSRPSGCEKLSTVVMRPAWRLRARERLDDRFEGSEGIGAESRSIATIGPFAAKSSWCTLRAPRERRRRSSDGPAVWPSKIGTLARHPTSEPGAGYQLTPSCWASRRRTSSASTRVASRSTRAAARAALFVSPWRIDVAASVSGWSCPSLVPSAA
jgi:hypothetical protein